MLRTNAFGLFIAIVLFSLIAGHYFPLSYDEAYYLVFAKHLALSYYDHPPMVAYLIHLATAFSDHIFFIRLPAFLCFISTCLIICALAKRMFSGTVANIALISCGACLIFFVSSFIITPDSPLLMFWALTIYFFYIGVFESKTRFLYLAGISSGFALMSKYTAILVYLNLFLFLIFSPSYRRLLLRKDIYLSLLCGLLVFSPVIYWNYKHNWISFLFQLNHGIVINSSYTWHTLVNYVLGQFGVINPILFVILIYYLISNYRHIIQDERLLFLLLNWLGVFIVFAYVSLTKQAEANWAAPMIITAIIFIAYFIDKYHHYYLITIAISLSLIVYLLGSIMLILAPGVLANRIHGVSQLFYNQQIYNELAPSLSKAQPILACDYANASYARYYLKLPVYVPAFLSFSHNYQYWQSGVDINNVLYICNSLDQSAMQAMQQHYSSFNLIKRISLPNNTFKTIYLYHANHLK